MHALRQLVSSQENENVSIKVTVASKGDVCGED